MEDSTVLQVPKLSVMGVLAAGLALSGCAAQLHSASAPAASAAAPAAQSHRTGSSAASSTVGQRNLTAAEKKAIIAVVAPNLRDPAAAKYHWNKVPVNLDNSTNYCATVNAKSPYPPYDGRQAYVVEINVQDNQITSAAMALIAGGKDAALVAKICAKYGLNPFGGT